MPNPHSDRTGGNRLPLHLPGTLLAFVLELGVTFALVEHWLLPALALHLMAIFISVRTAQRDRTQGVDMKFSLFFAVLVAASGPFGAGCALLTLAFYAWYARISISFLDWFSSLYPEQETEENLQVYDRILLGLENIAKQPQVEPFRDVLAFGDLSQKQAAIAKMTRYFTPAYAPLLRMALEDGENAVRVHAATALAKLDRDHMMTYLRMEKDCEEAPQDADALLALAAFCDAYANSGIADKSSAQAYRRKAAGYYERLSADAHGTDVSLTLARLYRQLGTPDKARVYLEGRLAVAPTSSELMTSYMETLYQMGRFTHLREFAFRNAHLRATVNANSAAVSSLLDRWTAPDEYQAA